MNLFMKTFKDYSIASSLIGPDYYMRENKIFSVSFIGGLYEILDYSQGANNRDKKTIANFIRWEEFEKITK
jgi:hypothetical protein